MLTHLFAGNQGVGQMYGIQHIQVVMAYPKSRLIILKALFSAFDVSIDRMHGRFEKA